MRMSLASILISTSSASGSTATVIAEVCTRPCCLGHRHALHAVHAALVLQLAVDFVAADQRDHFLESADRGFAAGCDFHVPVLRFGVARVHAEDFGREQRGFVAARAGADFEHDVLFVVGILGQQQDLQLVFDLRQLAAPERAISIFRHRAQLGVGLFQHGARLREAVFDGFFHSRYLATTSASSELRLGDLAVLSPSVMTAGSAICRVSSSKRFSIWSSF